MNKSKSIPLTRDRSYPALSRTLPFLLYMAFVGGQELCALAGFELNARMAAMLYPAKLILVAATLAAFWGHYRELDFTDLLNMKHTALSVGAGLAVFIAWINLDLPFLIMGEQTSFDPALFESATARQAIIAARVAGAVLVVPVMEELFWRSFLARYLLNKDFSKERIGNFTPVSFLTITILFGLEHQLFLAGMVAGAAYNLLLMHTRSLFHCTLSHAVTNLALAVYVLTTGQWRFW